MKPFVTRLTGDRERAGWDHLKKCLDSRRVLSQAVGRNLRSSVGALYLAVDSTDSLPSNEFEKGGMVHGDTIGLLARLWSEHTLQGRREGLVEFPWANRGDAFLTTHFGSEICYSNDVPYLRFPVGDGAGSGVFSRLHRAYDCCFTAFGFKTDLVEFLRDGQLKGIEALAVLVSEVAISVYDGESFILWCKEPLTSASGDADSGGVSPNPRRSGSS